jgi:hypothetical protein
MRGQRRYALARLFLSKQTVVQRRIMIGVAIYVLLLWRSAQKRAMLAESGSSSSSIGSGLLSVLNSPQAQNGNSSWWKSLFGQ